MSLGLQQARLLSAIGLEPMRLRDPADTLRRDPPAPAAAERTAAPARSMPGGRPAPASRPALPAPKAAPTTSPIASLSTPRPGLLLEALHRAAGGRDIGELAADLERLRRDPALKRALWPRLRALRRH